MDLNASSRPASAREMRAMLRDMDSYAQFAADANAAATVANFDLGSQKTRLMPGATNQAAAGQAAVKTEILPEYISQETAVRTFKQADTTENVPGKARLRIAYAGGAAVLLTGIIAAGSLMLVDEQKVVPEAVNEPVPEQKLNPAAETAPASDLVVPETSAETNSSTDHKAQGAKSDASVQAKQNQKTTSAGTASNRTATGENLDLDEDFDFNGKTIYVGNVKIKDGKVETPNAIIDENGVRPKTPPPPNMSGPEGFPDMRNLSPAQRRKLVEMRKRGVFPPGRQQPVRPRGNN